MKTSLIALSLLAALPFAASATDGLSYNHVEGGYVNTDAKGGDADGWALKGSVAVHPNFHVFGSYNTQETKAGNIDVDQWRLGVGYNHEIGPKTDAIVVLTGGYQRIAAGAGATMVGAGLQSHIGGGTLNGVALGLRVPQSHDFSMWSASRLGTALTQYRGVCVNHDAPHGRIRGAVVPCGCG